MLYRTVLIVSVAVLFAGCVSGRERALSADGARVKWQCELLRRLSEETIHRYDRNADGKLDRAEYGLWVADTERSTATPIDADAGFKQLDRNSDGFIDHQDDYVPSRKGGMPHAVPCR